MLSYTTINAAMGVLDWNTHPGRSNDPGIGLGVSASSHSQFLVYEEQLGHHLGADHDLAKATTSTILDPCRRTDESVAGA